MRYSIKTKRNKYVNGFGFLPSAKNIAKNCEVNMDKIFFINQKNMLLILLRLLQKERLKKEQK